MHRSLYGIVPIMLSVLVTLPAQAQQQFFLRLDSVQGESTSRLHPNEIEIVSWGWDVETDIQPVNTGGGTTIGGTSVDDISVIKYADRSTPALVQAVLTSQVFGEGRLSVQEQPDDPEDKFYLVLDAPRITSVRPGGRSGDGALLEQVTLTFSRYGICYAPLTARGDPPICTWYDRLMNVSGTGNLPP